MIRSVAGGVTAPRGFRAAGVACGIKKQRSGGDPPLDLALLVADEVVPAAAVFTTNRAVADITLAGESSLRARRTHVVPAAGWSVVVGS